jgi:hypothetical protein
VISYLLDEMSFRFSSRGFVLPLSIVIVFLALGLGWVLFRVSRQNLHNSLFYANKERAYHLARAAAQLLDIKLEKAISYLNSSDPNTFPKKVKSPDEVREIIQWLLDEHGFVRQEPSKLPLPVPGWEILTGENSGSSVDSYLELIAPQELFPASLGAMHMDPREIEFFFILRVEVKLRGASAAIHRFSRAKYVRILPHVLGKFVLFVDEPPLEGYNKILESQTLAQQVNSPVVIFPGKSLPPQSFGLAPGEVVNLVDQAGWLFFRSLSEMTFGVGKGGGVARYEDSFSESQMNLRNMEELDGVQTLLSEDGSMDYFVRRVPLFKELQLTEQKEVFVHESTSKIQGGSIFRLFGALDSPSPSLVLGPVSRRIAVIQGLFHKPNNKFSPLPFLNSSQYEEQSWPGITNKDAVEVLKMHFEEISTTPYEVYARRMSQLVVEDYNSALLDLLRASPSQVSSVPPSNLPLSQRLKADEQGVRFDRRIHSQRLDIQRDDGLSLYEGGDLTEFRDMSFFKNRVGISVQDTSEFLQKFVQEGVLNLGGVVQVRSNLLINEPLVLAPGGSGMILCEGDVEISAAIESSMEQILVIVSLNGMISLNVSEPCRFALIAMNGQVQLPSRFSLTGMVAAKDVKVLPSAPGTLREVRYHTLLDPTSSNGYLRGFRLTTENLWSQYVQ